MRIVGKFLSKLFLGVLLAGTLYACGGSGLDQTGAQKAALAVQNAQNVMQADFTASVSGGNGNGLTLTSNGQSLIYSGTLINPAGGSLSVTGSGTAAGGASSTLTITFTNWVDSTTGLTLSGVLTNNVTSTVTNPPIVSAVYAGTLQLSGSVTGSVVYALTIGVNGTCVTETGQVGGFTLNVKAGGC